MENDIAHRFVRCFTSCFPNQNGNKIIYFGYAGLDDNCKKASEMNEPYQKNSEEQKYQKYIVRDEHPRHNLESHRLEWEEKEENDMRKENEEIEMEVIDWKEPVQGGPDAQPEDEEYIHHPIYFRGMHLLPTSIKNKGK